MSTMPDELRRLKDYADNHMVFDLGLLLKAARHIELLEEERNGLRKEVSTLEGYLKEMSE